jgi:hypothetical protein
VGVFAGGRWLYWTIWQKQRNGDLIQSDSGVLTAMTEVSLVRVFTGKKKGMIANKPWSYQLCHVALEYYRSLARQTEIEHFSMLAGQGIARAQMKSSLGRTRHSSLHHLRHGRIEMETEGARDCHRSRRR